MNKLRSKTFVLLVIILVTALVIISISLVPQDSQATKLIVVSSTTFISLDKPLKLTIKAIDDKGHLDATRDDIIELYLTSVSYDKPMAKLNPRRIKLINGTGSAYIEGKVSEVVDVTIHWKEGISPLESSKLHLFIGIGEE